MNHQWSFKIEEQRKVHLTNLKKKPVINDKWYKAKEFFNLEVTSQYYVREIICRYQH